MASGITSEYGYGCDFRTDFEITERLKLFPNFSETAEQIDLDTLLPLRTT